jgi:hypothetical protein
MFVDISVECAASMFKVEESFSTRQIDKACFSETSLNVYEIILYIYRVTQPCIKLIHEN